MKTKQLKVGDPKENNDLGAVVSKDHMHKILEKIELAKEEGGQILCGGERVILDGELSEGYYIAPTIIEGLDHLCRTNQEEIFGPGSQYNAILKTKKRLLPWQTVLVTD